MIIAERIRERDSGRGPAGAPAKPVEVDAQGKGYFSRCRVETQPDMMSADALLWQTFRVLIKH
jgi:hypothetical protein